MHKKLQYTIKNLICLSGDFDYSCGETLIFIFFFELLGSVDPILKKWGTGGAGMAIFN